MAEQAIDSISSFVTDLLGQMGQNAQQFGQERKQQAQIPWQDILSSGNLSKLLGDASSFSPMGMAGTTKTIAKALDPLAQLVMDIAKGGESLSRNALMPTLIDKVNGIIAKGEPGGYHGSLWGQMAHSNPQLFMKMQDNPTMIEHAFQASTGAHVPYDVAGLLTGPFEPIKRVAEMLKKGTSLDTIMSILSPQSGPVL